MPLPPLPPGFVFLTDPSGNYLLDPFGNYLIVPGGATTPPSNIPISEFILEAYQLIHVRPESLRQEHMVTAQRELNMMFSSWSNRQPNLWEMTRAQITLVPGQAVYPIPTNVVIITDVSVVLNYGLPGESRRYIEPLSRTQYMSLGSQLVPGVPFTYWFDRLSGEKIGTLVISPTVSVYPVPNSSGYVLDYYAATQMQDAFMADGQTPDVPNRWYDALITDLAYRLARVYAPDLEVQRKSLADQAWQIAAAQDTENVHLVLSPSLMGYYRTSGYP